MAFLFAPVFGLFSKLCGFSILIVLVLLFASFTSTEAYDPLDPNGNITIKWDIISWTADGYVAMVTIYNFQQYRHIQAPGYTCGPGVIFKPTKFLSADNRRATQALNDTGMLWGIKIYLIKFYNESENTGFLSFFGGGAAPVIARA